MTLNTYNYVLLYYYYYRLLFLIENKLKCENKLIYLYVFLDIWLTSFLLTTIHTFHFLVEVQASHYVVFMNLSKEDVVFHRSDS